MPEIQIRYVVPTDAQVICELVQSLAASLGETSAITPEYAATYIASPSSRLFLAQVAGEVAGFISCSIQPNLYHAADTAMIDELIVAEGWRNQGIGAALLESLLKTIQAMGCAEISVTTMPENSGAQRFYRRHGLVDEGVMLEMHF